MHVVMCMCAYVFDCINAVAGMCVHVCVSVGMCMYGHVCLCLHVLFVYI